MSCMHARTYLSQHMLRGWQLAPAGALGDYFQEDARSVTAPSPSDVFDGDEGRLVRMIHRELNQAMRSLSKGPHLQ